MEGLKRVAWKVGQPLLPLHLVAQEDSLLAHTQAYFKCMGLPFYGINMLKWDDTLLTQGIVSIRELMLLFPAGQMIHIPGNGEISSFDLNKTGKNRVILNLNLLSSQKDKEDLFDSSRLHEKITFSVRELELSDDLNAPNIEAAMKLGEFEKDLENRWRLSESYIPPLLSLAGNPFFKKILIELNTKLEQFQNGIEMVSTDGEEVEGSTLETNLCLLAISKIRRLLLNIEHQTFAHPYFLYEALSHYLDTIALLHHNKSSFKCVSYQHDRLAPLFAAMMQPLSMEEVSNQEVSHLAFEKKERCYVSDKLPQELQDAKELYFIIQKVDTTINPNVEGVKLAAYSRLMNTVIFGVQGIPLIRIERAPFNHNFSKRANTYKVEKGVEWEHALKEGRLAFDYDENRTDVQAFLYWR